MGMAKSYTPSTVTITKRIPNQRTVNVSHIKNKSFKMARQRGGRIRPFERETDDSEAILGAGHGIQVAHSQGVRNMEQQGLVVRTKGKYRKRIKEMYVFFSLNYKDYYDVGVQKLSEEDRISLDLFHYKNTHDLIYTGINV
jgi:hypothetical protein